MNLSKSGIFVLAFLVSNLTIAFAESVSNDGQRQYTPRLRANDGFPRAAAPQEALETSVPTEEDSESAIMEWFDALAGDGFMSIDFSALPSDSPSEVPSEAPSTVTSLPTVSTSPSLSPSISQAPTVSGPQPTGSPSSAPTSSPSHMPSDAPSSEPSNAPSLEPTQGSNTIITADPTLSPTLLPSSEPTQFPSSSPSISPTSVPTVEGCTVSADVRTARILQLLRSVADPEAIADPQTDQGKATEWLLNEDPRKICPDHPKILQRWALAVVYFATGGDLWFQCSNSILATDECGAVVPFEGKQRFLSGFSECEWAGITCDDLDCVEELEFGKLQSYTARAHYRH